MNERRPHFFALCPAEPFRIFFPLATLLGISGVSLWPLFFAGLHKFYPGVMHSRLMIEGFLAGFVFGFLGTAMPRLLSAPPLRAWELWTLVTLHLTASGLHIGFQTNAGDAVFVALLLLFGVMLIRRVKRRAGLPPPGFVFVALGYLAGLIGTVLWLCGTIGWLPGSVMLLGGLWLNQAFALLLILGVGSFLIPRFLGLPDVIPMADERTASPAWRRRALFSLVLGALFLGSYWLEAGYAMGTQAAVLRGCVAIAYFAVMVPIHRTPEPGKTVPLAMNLSLVALVAGLVFPLFWPSQRVAGLHIIFIGGFSLVTFTVATRVVLGHSGNEHLFRSPLPSLRTVTLFIVASVILRAVADFFVESRAGLLNWASSLWMLAALAWSIFILPKVRTPDSTEEGTCKGRSKRLKPAVN